MNTETRETVKDEKLLLARARWKSIDDGLAEVPPDLMRYRRINLEAAERRRMAALAIAA